jgi:hypothetical protein
MAKTQEEFVIFENLNFHHTQMTCARELPAPLPRRTNFSFSDFWILEIDLGEASTLYHHDYRFTRGGMASCETRVPFPWNSIWTRYLLPPDPVDENASTDDRDNNKKRKRGQNTNRKQPNVRESRIICTSTSFLLTTLIIDAGILTRSRST